MKLGSLFSVEIKNYISHFIVKGNLNKVKEVRGCLVLAVQCSVWNVQMMNFIVVIIIII